MRLRKPRRALWIALLALVLCTVFCGVALAQAPGSTATSITDAYRASRGQAVLVFQRYAGNLFRALALVEMAWVAVLLVLERSDLQSWTAGMLRKLLVLFAFLYLLQNGAGFADRIMNSFIQIGAESAGMAVGHSPGDIFFRGLSIAETLVSKADVTGFLINPAPTLCLIISALMILISFVVVTIHFVMALVESYIVVSAGLIFLAFGGHSVTRPYVERFFSLAVAVGVKLMVIYMVIAIGTAVTQTWAAEADSISMVLFPFRLVFDLIGGSLIYAAVAWGVPKFTSSLLSGSPAFTGGDLISMGVATVQGAALAAGGAALAVRGAAVVVGGGAARLAAAAAPAAGAAGGSTGGGRGSGGPGGSPGNGGPGGGSPGGGGDGSSSGAYAPGQPAPPSTAAGSATNQAGPDSPGATSTVRTDSTGATTSERGSRPAAVSPVAKPASSSAPPHVPAASAPSSAVRTAAPAAKEAHTSASQPSGEEIAASVGEPAPPPTTPPEAAGKAPRGPSDQPDEMTRPAGQVAPPGWPQRMESIAKGAKHVEDAAATAQKVIQQAAMISFFASRLLPPEGGGGGTPPHLNINSD